MTRAQTLVLALLVLHVLMGGLCLAIARGPTRSTALRTWGAGMLIYAAGLLATFAGALLQARFVGNVLGNTLITAASAFCAAGILVHAQVRLSRLLVGAAIAATAIVLVIANFADFQRLIVNVSAPTVLAVALFSYSAVVIVRRGPAEARAACRVLAVLLGLAMLTWVARIAALLAVLDGGGTADAVDLVISLSAIAQMVNGVAATLALMWIDVRLMQAELGRVADSDPLTGLPNRRAIMNRFVEEAARAARYGQRFALTVLDIDHFKRINDRHGHIAGDSVLNEVGRALRLAKRGDDALGRLGGEEFVLILPQQAREGALEASQRLREAVSRAAVVAGGETVRVTVSGGIAIYPEDGESWDALFATADRRLYEAKRGGRDRIHATG